MYNFLKIVDFGHHKPRQLRLCPGLDSFYIVNRGGRGIEYAGARGEI